MRNRTRRKLHHSFSDVYYKPRGIPLRNLQEVVVSDEELEVLRLRYLEKLDQNQAAQKMKISQSQYQRDLVNVMEKITAAFIESKAIKISVSEL
jgi:uncharacterized protein